MMCHQANDFQVTDERVAAAPPRDRPLPRRRPLRDLRRLRVVGHDAGRRRSQRDVPRRRRRRCTARRTPRSTTWRDAATDCFPVTELFSQFAGRDDVMLIPHIGGRYADIVGFHDPALEPVVEIYSDWGRFEWLLEDALTHGYKVGVVANSDGHKGRPGASHPGRLDLRRLRRAHLRAGRVADPRGRVRGDQGAPLLRASPRRPAHPRRARRERPADGGRRAAPTAR